MRVTRPPVRWDARRPLAVTLAASAFVLLCFVVPRPTGVALGRERLEIDDILDDLSAKIDVLEQEEILEEQQADALTDALEDLGDDASGEDPARTWEAIDHLSGRLSEEALAEAEEALARAAAMARAEALAQALAEALGDEEAAAEIPEAAQELAALLEQMGLAEQMPESAMEALRAGEMSTEELARLAEALRNGQVRIAEMVERLANARLVEGALCQRCAQCAKAGDAELAAFLAQVGQNGECAALVSMLGCRGGISRGRGDAAMTWTAGSSEDGAGFRDEGLPTELSGLEDSRLVGVSQGAPEANDGPVATASGALAGTAGGPGSASKHRLLPRHRAAVQRFFSRE
jgi:hypothetical protein